MHYLLTRIENHQRSEGIKVKEDKCLMGIAYESELMEIAQGECLSHTQLVRHIKLLHHIIESYELPGFDDMIDWHHHLLHGEAYAGKLRNFPAGRFTSNGAWEKYPAVNVSAVQRMFAVFNGSVGHSLVAIAHFHIAITEAHPFIDGNGRVCRLILNAHLHVNGFGLCLISRDNKEEYLDLLESRNSAGLAKFIGRNLVM